MGRRLALPGCLLIHLFFSSPLPRASTSPHTLFLQHLYPASEQVLLIQRQKWMRSKSRRPKASFLSYASGFSPGASCTTLRPLVHVREFKTAPPPPRAAAHGSARGFPPFSPPGLLPNFPSLIKQSLTHTCRTSGKPKIWRGILCGDVQQKARAQELLPMETWQNSRNGFLVPPMMKVQITLFLPFHRELLECRLLPKPIILPALLYFPRGDECRHFFLLQDINPPRSVSGKPGQHRFHQTRAEM